MSIMIDVAIPWRARPDCVAAFDRCTRYWGDNGFNVIVADSDPVFPFLCNASRNNAVCRATSDVVVIADGDTLPGDIDQVCAAGHLVSSGRYDLVWPFDTYRHIPNDQVDVEDLSKAPIVKQYTNSPAGIIVVNRERFWDIGGFDERFTPGQWGFDDTAFALAARTLLRTKRLPGVVYSFDHAVEGGRDLTDNNRNRYLYTLYRMALGKPAKMKELIGCPATSG
jgi:hypothetical protein